VHLSKFTDYSLRVMIYLAAKPDELSTIDEISNKHDLSKEHLRKIVYNLAQNGLIESRRGRSGGLRLAYSASDIKIGTIVRVAEDGFCLADCFRADGGTCRISGCCQLNDMFHEALNAFLAVLDKYTLADILIGQPVLFQRLGLFDFMDQTGQQ
jgi:Rrf2 family nitric oxide-sensitive transcriptional repressor